MFEKFSKYLVNKLSCLCQAVNDDSSSDEHSESNSGGSHNSSHCDDDSYQEDSFKSYSEEESWGEDVVESTGRSGTRSSNYEENPSKNTGSTHTIGNTEVPSLIEQHKKKKNTSLENTKKSVKLRVKNSSPRTKQEVQHKSPELEKNPPKQTSKKFSKNPPKRERSKRDLNLKKLQTMNSNNVKQKDDKKLNTTKEDKETTDEKVPRLRKSSLKVKENEKNVNPNREDKTRERIAKEKKDAKQTEEKRRTEEKKERGKISKAVRETNPKTTPNNQNKSTSSILPKKMSSEETESKSQMRKPTKNISSKVGTFSKGANKSSSRRSVPTFTSKSIQKRRPIK